MEKVVIFGTGEIASVAHFYLTHDSSYEVVAFTVDKEFIKEHQFLELPIVPFEEIEKTYPPDKFRMFVPISYRNVNKLRAEKYYQAKEKGYQLISYISSKATTWPGLVVGDNCFIFENNVIQPFVRIGNNVILWSGNHIGHHTVIKDHCFIASHVVISGSVTIEPYCFLGVNATIRDGIIIARECVIGAGSLILKDTAEREVYRGMRTKPFLSDSSHLKKI
ncbi:UDP-3-O-(3-hydroxymyristoyl)glucosamine N-acyltransferase [subsurface metagenome]